jgi:hypothetical protein
VKVLAHYGLLRHGHIRQAIYFNGTLRLVRATNVAVERNEYYIFWVWVCCLTYPACNEHAPYFISDLSDSTVFFHILTNCSILEKKLLNIKCVFWFSFQLPPKIFFIQWRIQLRMIKNVCCSYVKYPSCFSDFSEIWIFSTYFRKIFQCKIS